MDSSNLFSVGDKVFENICQMYGRDEKSLKEDVTTLKNWLTSQAHLPEMMDEKRIENFLLLNKCSIEKTKQTIDMYYTMRSQIPELYVNTNPKCPKMQQMMETECWVLLPKLTKEMHRVHLFKMFNKNLIDEIGPFDISGLSIALYEIRLAEDVVFGDVLVFDMDGLNFGYFTKLTPSILAKMFAVYEKVFSVPMKGLYILNASSFIGTIFPLLKSVMKPKLFERVFVCEDTSILNERFPKEMLPRDYGGEEKSTEELFELVKLKVNQYQDRFDTLDNLKVDETLRPEPLKNDEVFGFYGNFKKLGVD